MLYSISYNHPVANNKPVLKGLPAGRIKYFGENSRFSIRPVHTRFDSHGWVLKDAEDNRSSDYEAFTLGCYDTFAEALSTAREIAQ